MYYIFTRTPPSIRNHVCSLRSHTHRTSCWITHVGCDSCFAGPLSSFARTPPSIRNHVCSLCSHTRRTSCWITHVGRDSCFAGITCKNIHLLTCKHDAYVYSCMYLANSNLEIKILHVFHVFYDHQGDLEGYCILKDTQVQIGGLLKLVKPVNQCVSVYIQLTAGF